MSPRDAAGARVRPHRTAPDRVTAPPRPLTPVPGAAPERRGLPFVAVVVAVMGLGLVGLLLLNTTVNQGAFTLSELEERSARLDARAEALALDVDAASSSERLATDAAALGMVQVPQPVFVHLDGTVVGDPRPALPGATLPGLTPPAEQADRPTTPPAAPGATPERGRGDERGGGAEPEGRSEQDRADGADRNDRAARNGRNDRDDRGGADRRTGGRDR